MITRRWRAFALAGLLGTVVTTVATTTPASSQSSSNPFASPTAFCTKSTAPPGTRNSSSPGVSPSTITIADASLDVEQLRKLGSDQMNFHQAFQTYWDEVNKCGGINGRKVIL